MVEKYFLIRKTAHAEHSAAAVAIERSRQAESTEKKERVQRLKEKWQEQMERSKERHGEKKYRTI